MDSDWIRTQVPCTPEMVNICKFIAKVKTVPILCNVSAETYSLAIFSFDEMRPMKNFPRVGLCTFAKKISPLKIIARQYDPFDVTRIKKTYLRNILS